MVEQLNTIARLWWEWSAAMFWQVGLLILVIATLDRVTRRWAWPQLRYALWSLVLIKLLLPPSLSLPSGVVPSVAPIVKQGLARLQAEKPPVAEGRALFSLTEDMFSVHSVPVRASEEVPSLKGQVSSEQGQEPPLETPNLELQTSSLVWQVYAMTASFAGTLILGIWLYLRLHSLVGRRAQETAAASLPQSFYNQLAACARRLELGYIPRVVVTRRLATPAVFGMFRPVLLMPKGYLGKLSRRDTEHMLLHELAHIKRGDLIAHGLYMLLQVAYWYNPLLWLVRRQVHHLRELSCDATVAELLREQTTAYRQTLLETARRLLTSSVEPGLGLLGLFEDSNRLLVRLNWLTKPTWRYRTMKRVTVAVVAALMLTCVLPMARAREAVSHQPSPEVVHQSDQTSQEIAALQTRLEELMVQQKQLQEQLQALTRQRSQTAAKTQLRHSTSSSQGDVTIVPWQNEDPAEKKTQELRHALQETVRAEVEQRRADVETQRAKAETRARQARAETLRATAEGERIEAEVKRQEEMARQREQWAQSEAMQRWRADMEKWENSDEVNRWKREVEQWARNLSRPHERNAEDLANDAIEQAEGGTKSVPPAMPAMPPMPAMPAMPKMPPMSANVHIPIPQVAPSPEAVPHVEAVPGMPVPPEAPRKEKAEQAVPCGEFVVKSFPAEGALLVENNVGSIAVEGTDADDCTVVATARIKGVEREEAERMAKRILVQVTPVQGRVRVRTQFLDDWDQEQRDRVAIDLKVAVPGGAKVQVAQKVGDVSLVSLRGAVAATADVGAIQAWNLQGDASLRTNVGNITFVTSSDLSAKMRAQTQIGSISSNLPLEITRAAVAQAGGAQNALGSHATGTLGGGQNKIDLNANVGSIQIRRKDAAKHEVF